MADDHCYGRPDVRRGSGRSPLGYPRAAGGALARGAHGHRQRARPYYGFWSGFGSDLTEFAIIGTIATGVYQPVQKYNCHYPGCWRVGNHPAAGGQFSLCYLHHPDYHGKKPTEELIQRLHREHLERQAALLGRFHEIREHLADKSADAGGVPGPDATTAPADRSGNTQADRGTLEVTDDPARHVKSR